MLLVLLPQSSMVTSILLGVAAFYAAGLLIVIRFLKRAPQGREDAGGFHLEEDAASHAEKPARQARVWLSRSRATPTPAAAPQILRKGEA
jgi:hypothetical protein